MIFSTQGCSSAHPGNHEHGFNSVRGPHAGDLPNITIDERGLLRGQLISRAILKEGTKNLLQKTGTSIVIHAKADDEKTQPAGNSGDRIACGVIKG